MDREALEGDRRLVIKFDPLVESKTTEGLFWCAFEAACMKRRAAVPRTAS